jgi:hypothetical protein
MQSDKESLHFSEYRIREFAGGDYAIRPRGEARANARLISQAPEMAELLRHWLASVPLERQTTALFTETERLLAEIGGQK